VNNFFVYLYISTIEIAFIASLLSFRLNYPRHLKIFSLILGCDFLGEILSNYLLAYFGLRSNVPVYNFVMLIEFLVYGIFFLMIVKRKSVRKIIVIYLILYTLFWFVSVFFVFGLWHWNSYAIIAGGLSTICMAAFYYYQLFTAEQLQRLDKSPEFWISTGLIIFYACNMPYFGMLNVLTKNFPTLAEKQLILLQVLNILEYSLFTYAYICRIPIRKSLSS